MNNQEIHDFAAQLFQIKENEVDEGHFRFVFEIINKWSQINKNTKIIQADFNINSVSYPIIHNVKLKSYDSSLIKKKGFKNKLLRIYGEILNSSHNHGFNIQIDKPINMVDVHYFEKLYFHFHLSEYQFYGVYVPIKDTLFKHTLKIKLYNDIPERNL
jgi:hypothetical protein